jgi:hypothetical protein
MTTRSGHSTLYLGSGALQLSLMIMAVKVKVVSVLN